MIKRESKKNYAEKGMVTIINSESKCFCGHPFDMDGICANGHMQDKKYDVPENMVKNKKTEKNTSSSRLQVCKKSFGSRCSICGAFIPEGDNVCDHGHMLGVKYPNREKTK